jgi:hypothetical protein
MMKVPWMTELPERCDHPNEYLKMEFDMLDQPYWQCQKCGYSMCKDEKIYREKQDKYKQTTLV